MVQTDRQTHRQTDIATLCLNRPSWADSVKTVIPSKMCFPQKVFVVFLLLMSLRIDWWLCYWPVRTQTASPLKQAWKSYYKLVRTRPPDLHFKTSLKVRSKFCQKTRGSPKISLTTPMNMAFSYLIGSIKFPLWPNNSLQYCEEMWWDRRLDSVYGWLNNCTPREGNESLI